MAKLSRKEQDLLDSLTRKAEAPDSGPISKSVSVHIDLSDPKQVSLARRHGFLDGDDDDEGDEGEGDDDEGRTDDTPKRRGYFD